MKILPKFIAVGLSTLLIFASALALTDPEPNPFSDLEEGEQVFEGTVAATDGEILTIRKNEEEEFSGRFDQIFKYRDGGGPAAANEFATGDRVRAMVDAAGVVRAAQNAELLLCDQNFYGWVREPDAAGFTLETVAREEFTVLAGPTTQFRDEAKQILFGYSPRDGDIVRIHGVVNTNARKIFTETFGAYVSLLSEEALAPFIEEVKKERAEREKEMLATPVFTDVSKDHEFYFAAQFVQSENFVNGYADDSFRPENPINRAEFTKILVAARFVEELAAAGEEDSETVAGCFSDVPADAWFAPFVCFAKEKGILGGYPDGSFQPANSVNLAEAVTILIKTFGFSVDGEVEGEWFAPFLQKAAELSILPDGLTEASTELTRGQMSELVMRATKYTRGELADYLENLEGVAED